MNSASAAATLPMKLRETISEKPIYVAAFAAMVLIVPFVFIFWQARDSGTIGGHARAFFSVDDGKTWFADDAAKIAPFDKDGKQAVRAYVYRRADGSTFVNHLERFKPEARQAIEAANKPDPNAKGPPRNLAAIQSAYTAGREVKRPGDTKWTATGNFRDAALITSVKSPTGGAEPVPVVP